MENNDIRQFMNVIRTAKNAKTLNENADVQGSTPLAPQAPSTEPTASSEAKEEEKLFTQSVGMAYFGNFQKQGNNVTFQGSLGSGESIKWYFSLADGCVISTEQFTLDNENYGKIEKLKAYFDIWKAKWENQITGIEKPI
jgi:uncharacterized protein YkwD